MAIRPAPDLPAQRRANKAEVAEFFDVSLPAVDGWVRRGCPILQKGSRGVPWVFDLLEVARWRFGGEEGPDEDLDPRRLPPKERKDWIQSEREWHKHLLERREVIPKAEIRQVVATAFAAFAQDARAIPDHMERRQGITPDMAVVIGDTIDGALDAMANRLQSLADEDERDAG